MAKEITYNEQAREKLVAGVDAVANAVKVTLGPKGRNVIIGKPYGCPQIVNDGVTIAKEIELKDALENAGAQLLKEVSSKTNDVAGDGTTTASVLAQAIVHEGLKYLGQDKNPVFIKDGINKAVKDVVEFIKEQSVKVDDTLLAQVATISAGNNVEIGQLIAKAIKKAGEDGVVTVEESPTLGTTLKCSEGMQIDQGYLSNYFITDVERLETVLEKPVILCVNKKINLIQDLVPILETIARDGKSLLLIAEDVEGDALAAMVVNSMRKIIRACAVKAPGFGEQKQGMLEDIAVLTGGKVWTEELGMPLDEVATRPAEFFGNAVKVVVTKDNTTIVVGEQTKDMVEQHVKMLKAQLEKAETDYQKEKLQQRIAKLVGGVVVIQVGAPSEVELKEQKLRIEDALNATKAAKEEGIVAGGGYTLLKAKQKFSDYVINQPINDETTGYSILVNSLSLPLKQIAINSGVDGDEVVSNCYEKGLGYNALTGSYENLLETGVVDPAKVTRSALENAASVAGMLLTTEAAIVDEPQKDGDLNAFKPQAAMPMM